MGRQSAKRQKRKPGNSPLFFGGRRVVLEALKGQQAVNGIFFTANATTWAGFREIRDFAERANITLQEVDESRLDRMTGGIHHQGVVCEVKALPATELDDILQVSPLPNLVALDQVQDPMNLGAVLRLGNACGIGGVICPRDRSAPLSAATVKASAGAALHTPVVYVTNLARALSDLKQKGYWIVVLEGDEHAVTLQDSQVAAPWVLVAGSEGKGIRPLVKKQADFRVSLPMLGAVSSLNVASACAIATFFLTFCRDD